MTDKPKEPYDKLVNTTLLPKPALIAPTTPLQGQAGATAPTMSAISAEDLATGTEPDTTFIIPPKKVSGGLHTTILLGKTDLDIAVPEFNETPAATEPESTEHFINPETPELQKVPNTAGAKVAARAGITKDGEIKELPGVILDIELWMDDAWVKCIKKESEDCQKSAWEITKLMVTAYGGDIIHFIPTPAGQIRCQAIFENEKQARQAAYKIKSKVKSDKVAEVAKFGMGEDTIKVATHNGHILLLGPAAAAAFKLQHANSHHSNAIASNNRDMILGHDLKEIEIDKIAALHSRITPESERHATSSIRMPNPDMPKNATRVEMRIPKEAADDPEKAYSLAKRFIDAIAPHPMEKDSKYTPTHVVFTGATLTIYLPEERSPGNLGDRLSYIHEEIIKEKVIILVSQSAYAVVHLDENNHTFQGVLPSYATKGNEIGIGLWLDEDLEPGVYMDEAFQREACHERNESIAKFIPGKEIAFTVGNIGKRNKQGKLDEAQGTSEAKLIRVDRIETTDEIIVSGRKTIGRAKEVAALLETINKVVETGEAEVTVVEGEAGVGKTRHAKDAESIAETKGFTSVNFKTLEKGKTRSGSGVKRLLHSLFKKLPTAARTGFRDLELFEKGVVPPGEAGEYGGQVAALNSQSTKLAGRFMEFMEITTSTTPVQLTMDDLQWLDAYSIEVISRFIIELPQSAKLHLLLLGRSEEEKIPQDILNAVATRTDHNRNTKLERINNKEKLEREIQEENPAIGAEELETKVTSRIFELTKEYIYTNLPEGLERTPIAEGFVHKIATLSQGLPIVITEVISLLLMKGDLSLNAEEIKTPSDTGIDGIVGTNPTETLSTIIQAKFERLTPTELEIVDYLVVYGTTDAASFSDILKNLGMEETKIATAIEGLQKKKIINGKPIEFTHDLIRREREVLMETRGELSVKAASCYDALSKHGKQYPHEVTSAQLFDLIEAALKKEDALKPETATKLKADRVKTGTEAINHHITNQNALRALEIAEKLMDALRKSSDTESQKILGELHLQAAESHLRLGHEIEPTEVLEACKALATQQPEAELNTGKAGLRYQVLKVKAAFAAGNPAALRLAMTELQTTLGPLTMEENSERFEPHVIVAGCELTLANLRLAMLRKDAAGLAATDPKAREDMTTLKLIANVARLKGEKETLLVARSLITDLYRQLHVAAADIHLTGNYGKMGEELVTLTELETMAKTESARLESRLQKALEKYKSDSELVRDPQTFGYLYVLIAKLQITQGKTAEANQTIERGLNLSRNWGLPETTAALYLLTGDAKVTESIDKRNPSEFDGEGLKSGIRGYTQAITEMSRGGGKDTKMADTNQTNRALATALYGQWVAAKNPGLTTFGTDSTASLQMTGMEESVAILSETKELIEKSWEGLTETLRKYKKAYRDHQVFLMELATVGLLIKAAGDLDIRLTLPNFITADDIATERRYLEQLAKTIPTNPPTIDKKLLDLRLTGINSFSK